MTVIDASLAVKWFFPELETEAAQKFLSNSDRLTAPALIRVEVTAALARKVHTGEILPKFVERARNPYEKVELLDC